MIIERINSPKDVKELNNEELIVLAEEIRKALLQSTSKFGGHIGPNLGVVELTIALHYVFNAPYDKIVFDVSHQCYTHKILTGRKYAYLEDDKHDLVSGFTNPHESEYDTFEIGHTSTAISLANGLARGRDLINGKENVIAIIGDGSLSGGEAYEGLNNVVETNTNTIIIVNDNENSIAENHGGYAFNLAELRKTNGTSDNNFFKALGFDYRYVENGNDVLELIKVLKSVKDIDHPIVLHIHTVKGKGYEYAVKNPEAFHCPPPFDLETGEIKKKSNETYPELTISYLSEKIEEGEPVAIINAATPGFVFAADKEKRKKLGKHFIDVGIAEEHAAAMSSGMSKEGVKAVWGVSSSFLQRTYDQISQDICLNDSPVTILTISGGGLSGQKNPTHSGIFDVSMLASIPNLVHLCPIFKEEYLSMLDYAIHQSKHPTCIRMPSKVISCGKKDDTDYSLPNKAKIIKKGQGVAIFVVGNTYELALELDKELGGNATIINPAFLSGLDKDLLEELKLDHKVSVILEDGVRTGGYGERIAAYYGLSDMKVLPLGIEKEFHRNKSGSQMILESKMDPKDIEKAIKPLIK